MRYLHAIDNANWDHRNPVDFAFNASPAQMGMFREICRTHGLRKQPSPHYGIRHPMNINIPHHIANGLLKNSHSNHMLAEHFSSNKSASGWGSAILSGFKTGARTAVKLGTKAVKYGAKAAAWMAQNPKLVKTAVDVAVGTAGAGKAFGWWGDDVVGTTGAIAKALNDFQNPEQKKEKEKGSGFLIL